jgi:hypothetical protein
LKKPAKREMLPSYKQSGEYTSTELAIVREHIAVLNEHSTDMTTSIKDLTQDVSKLKEDNSADHSVIKEQLKGVTTDVSWLKTWLPPLGVLAIVAAALASHYIK